MIFNSLVLAYRQRPQHLILFLAALERCWHWEPFEIVVVDLASQGTEEVIPFIDLPIKYHWVDYHGVFWKSKALNFGASKARGELLTVMDVDCLPVPSFLGGVEEFFAVGENHNKKLGHRVRMTSQSATTMAIREGIEWTDANILGRVDRFPNYFNETYRGKVTGNSQFTMRRELFLGLGGMDEEYCGWGAEDHDFNLRAHALLGPTIISEKSELYHLWHDREVNWDSPQATQKSRARFFHVEAGSAGPLIMGKEWGTFP